MKINKNPFVTAGLMVAVVIILIAATLLLGRQKDREDDRGQIETTDPAPDASSSVEGGTQTAPSPSYIPDIDANQSDYAKPYDALDVLSMSATTLTKEEVTESVADLLDGLLRLDTESIERVSPKRTGGEHNPFRVMLNAALADEELKAAFINMGGRSCYEILDISFSTNSPNVYTVIISASTPYMASLAPELAAGEQLMYVQELTRLKASGAARAIAEMDLSTIPLSTDIVTLAILVEDDVPVLYYPTSLTYGGEIPQYAFLWGAIDFQGTNNGDLLLRNDYGAGTEVSAEEFCKNGKCNEFALYIDTVLGNIKKADMEMMAGLSVAGDSLGTHWALKVLYPEYQALFSQHESLEKDTLARLKSFEFSVRYFINTEPGSGVQIYTTAITYSVLDQGTGRRVFNTRHFVLTPGISSLSESEGALINNMVSEILEDVIGGSAITAETRMYLSAT